LHEMAKMGGLRVNFYLTVRLLKEEKRRKGR